MAIQGTSHHILYSNTFTYKQQKAAMLKARLPVQASDHRERDKQVVASLGLTNECHHKTTSGQRRTIARLKLSSLFFDMLSDHVG
jgi:hypothetical protein